MKVICKSCNIDFELGKKDKFSCPSCDRQYNKKAKTSSYNIKFITGLLQEDLSESDVKAGILNGKYLSVDFVAANETPWIRFRDSEFKDIFKTTTIIKDTGNSSKSWMLLFWVSFIVNLVLLGLIWFQKGRIDTFLK